MEILKKKCVVIYDEDGFILTKTENNSETYVGIGRKYAEFDIPEEMEQFINEKKLKEIE